MNIQYELSAVSGCILVFSQKILKVLPPYFFREVGAYMGDTIKKRIVAVKEEGGSWCPFSDQLVGLLFNLIIVRIWLLGIWLIFYLAKCWNFLQ